MWTFEFQQELRHAIRTINTLITHCEAHGGGVFMVEKDNPDFLIKLKRPIDVLSYEMIVGNDGT